MGLLAVMVFEATVWSAAATAFRDSIAGAGEDALLRMLPLGDAERHQVQKKLQELSARYAAEDGKGARKQQAPATATLHFGTPGCDSVTLL